MSGFDAIFKAYDIRGVYPEEIDGDRCRAIGAAFARFVSTDDPEVTRVVIAHDMRPSGPELVEAFTAGVVAQGLDVVELGLASTDMMYFASGHLDAGGLRKNPTESYTDPELADREWQTFFRTGPSIIGLSGDLPEPGSFRTFSDLGTPLLATRDDEGRFKTPAQLTALFKQRGIVPDNTAVCY